MATFKFVISENAKSYQVEKDQKDAPVFGKKIGDTISGDFLGLDGYELRISGGSDRDGFPMRADIEGTLRKKFLVTKGIGFSGKKKRKKGKYKIGGMRRRKTLRGNTVDQDISQINCKIVKAGATPLAKLLGKEEKEMPKEKTEGPEVKTLTEARKPPEEAEEKTKPDTEQKKDENKE